MQTTNADLIIIKGAPASGKSQAAKELAKYFPKGVRIEIDNIRSMVISVDWTNQEEHISILNLSIRLVHDFYCMDFKPIIIIDTFSGDKVNQYIERLRLQKKEWNISIFGLFTTESEIKRRLDARQDDKFKDYSISRKLNEDIIKYRHEQEIQVDTTNLESKETAKIIYEQLTAKNTGNQ